MKGRKNGKGSRNEKKDRMGSEKNGRKGRNGGWFERRRGGCLVCLATGADPVIRERLGIVVAAAPRPLYGAMDGAHKGWMAPTMNRGYPPGKSPTKQDTHERGYP